MAASAKSGPQFDYGDLTKIAAMAAGGPVPDPNQDAGPNGVYQWMAWLDARINFNKDQITGFTGKAQAHLEQPTMRSASVIPSQFSVSNIAAPQQVATGVAMTLAGLSTGITPNVPLNVFSPFLGTGALVTAMALDFGFQFGTTVAGSGVVTVPAAATADYTVGMPLVIAGAGNAAGTIPLLTNVQAIGTTTITVGGANNAGIPLASIANAAIGAGFPWGPTEVAPQGTAMYPTPTAAYPFVAGGPGLFLDTRQSLSRGVQINGTNAGCTGGNFLVSGYDIYGQAMTQLITVAAGVAAAFSKKTFKYIASVVPQFTDANAAHTYEVGTSDVFGFAYRSTLWEETRVLWAGAQQTSATGWVTADKTNPATNLTGDVRGTIQVSAQGGGSGIGSTTSNGTVANNAVTGNRLVMEQLLGIVQVISSTQNNPVPMFGSVQS